MIIYFPLIVYETEGEEKELCDYLIYGYKTESEAKELHPDAEILKIDTEANFNLN